MQYKRKCIQLYFSLFYLTQVFTLLIILRCCANVLMKRTRTRITRALDDANETIDVNI